MRELLRQIAEQGETSLRQAATSLFPRLSSAQVTALLRDDPVPPGDDWWHTLGAQDEIDAMSLRAARTIDQMFCPNLRPGIVCFSLVSDIRQLPLLRRACEGFIAQTYPDKILIVFDDTDSPTELFRADENRIYCCRVPPALRDAPDVTREHVAHALADSELERAFEGFDPRLAVLHWSHWDIYDPRLLSYLTANYTLAAARNASDPPALSLERSLWIELESELCGVTENGPGLCPTMLSLGAAAHAYVLGGARPPRLYTANLRPPIDSLVVRVHNRHRPLPPETRRTAGPVSVELAAYLRVALRRYGLDVRLDRQGAF